MSRESLSGLHRLSLNERLDALAAAGSLTKDEAQQLAAGRTLLSVQAADRMIENVIAAFGLPLAVAPHFLIDGREYLLPLVVEEPSVVAALSAAGKLARRSGGFRTECEESLLAGQVHLSGFDSIEEATVRLEKNRDALLESANAVHPRLAARGGGVRELELRPLELADGSALLAVHILVDTCDAMGANLVNTICEALAPALADISGGRAALRILSNYADRSIVRANVRIGRRDLGGAACEAIVRAADIAAADPWRAVTHNKGVMNGIDALAIATGNDWRAIEAGAHAWAARDGQYRPLTRWRIGDDGDLHGDIELPLKPGIVGGSVAANPGAELGLRIAGVGSARELARVMAAAGLAQNFAALRALATTGIQAGHMRLHARSLVAAAGAGDAEFDGLVRELIASGEIKDWKARELVERRRADRVSADASHAAGKVILLGEHAAVYGKRVLALPIARAVRAEAQPAGTGRVRIDAWGLDEPLPSDSPIGRAVQCICEQLGVGRPDFDIAIDSSLPRGMGLGSSAATAVAVTRAIAAASGIDLDDDRVNAIAFECEKLAHGTPSGVDNTVASFGRALLYRRGEPPELLDVPPPPLVIACSHTPGSTLQQVADVRARRDALPAHYDALFDEIDRLSKAAAAALSQSDYERLGALMNVGQGLLNAIGVSTPELEAMLAIARGAGACGAKLTGAGGGGSIVALCPGREADVDAALGAAGFKTIRLTAAKDESE